MLLDDDLSIDLMFLSSSTMLLFLFNHLIGKQLHFLCIVIIWVNYSYHEVDEIQDQSVSDCPSHSMTGHTSPHDAYLWRQYGKRVVIGNDFPVRYYICSYPGCTVRKKCARSPTGEITEIVYRDSHHHPKPHLI
ncbi:hypothetical protein ABFS83_08G168500 [Erythranthe nasuta]